MPDNPPLRDFIEAAKTQGASDEFLAALLRQNGWSDKRIYQALAASYEARTGIPVPNGGGRMESAKDAFLYLLAFITLGIWAIQMGSLLFSAIDRTFPNPRVDYNDAAMAIRSLANELASIIIAFPLFLLVTRSIVRGIQRQPERLESSVRKWLTYIALVITASTIIGDLVTFLAYFLRGDLDLRFVLKVLTVLLIAGGVFSYYLDSLHRERVSSSRDRLFTLGAAAVVAFSLIVGFIQIGSPAKERLVAADARRLHDLSLLAQGLHQKWLTRGENPFVLPGSIDDLPVPGSAMGASTFDPVSGWKYRYTPLRGTSYRLCAAFSRPSPPDIPATWRHPAGNACFPLDASDNVDVQRQY